MPQAQKRVKYAIDKGYVTSKEISTALGGLEKKLDSSQRISLCDDIASAARWYTFDGTPGFFGRLYLAGKDVANKAATLTSMVAGAAIGAEYQAAKAFAGTILADKLNGSYDHLLYWLGQKSVEVNGLEMINAMAQMVKSTPSIVIGMGVGALGGWLGYRALTYACKSLYNYWRKNRAAAGIVQKYALGA